MIKTRIHSDNPSLLLNRSLWFWWLYLESNRILSFLFFFFIKILAYTCHEFLYKATAVDIRVEKVLLMLIVCWWRVYAHHIKFTKAVLIPFDLPQDRQTVVNHTNIQKQPHNQQIEKGTLIYIVQTSNMHCLCYLISDSSSHKSRPKLSTFKNIRKLNKREKEVTKRRLNFCGKCFLCFSSRLSHFL